jgi:hypothetical protein
VPVSEQDRLKALKEHDTEAYYNLLKEHKNEKILNVLTETDKYLKALGLAVWQFTSYHAPTPLILITLTSILLLAWICSH